MTARIAIVGAGLAGATAARLLTRAGAKVTVFEKSGGTGGRLSTRRTDYGSFDHGAQYVSARGDAFLDTVYRLVAEGGAMNWSPAGKDREDEWHVGHPGMSGFVKPLLGGIDVRTNSRVSAIQAGDDAIRVQLEDGREQDFEVALVTAPAPQSLALLKDIDGAFAKIAKAQMAPCWSVMLAFGKRIDRLPDIRRGNDGDVLGWIARDSSKPGREGLENIVVHAGTDWSRDHLEETPEAVLDAVLTALRGAAGGEALSPVHAVAHRWRYARVDRPVGEPFLAGCRGRVIACGDWCIGARAEAAFDSGRLAAEFLVRERLAGEAEAAYMRG
ncbi:NAD(P)/FAD-dependent oxidoreductase [Oricola cellulosilytica]|nr:FAD-dependent oxidoreductase [Oricola cellulosilytica]